MDQDYRIRELKKKQEQESEKSRQRASALRRRDNQLDEILAHNLLTMHALIEALIKKGVITQEDILAASEEVDMRDGVKDGALSPESTLPQDVIDKSYATPNDFLRRLERRDLQSPRNFLDQLSSESSPEEGSDAE